MDRGVFIVIEGLDRAGKTTQCQRLCKHINSIGKPCECIGFPDRSTPIGKLIDAYLRKEIEMDDHAIHLLFTANRWELKEKINTLIESGTSVVCDRYSFSGVAYSCAKKCLDFDWCYSAETGLPAPDLVIFLDLVPAALEGRSGFGEERYELSAFQEAVGDMMKRVRDASARPWFSLTGSYGLDETTALLIPEVEKIVRTPPKMPLRKLWE